MRRWWTGAVATVFACASSGCVDADKTECGDLVCPAQLVCMAATGECVRPERIDACRGHADGDDCAYAGVPAGACSGGLCVPLRCGDGRIDGAEQCDGDDVSGVACTDLGFYDADGVVVCSSECRLDTTACTGFCGDALTNGGEACDGDDLGGLSCTDFGYYQAAGLSCTPACVYDTNLCDGRCGDGIVNGGETCDELPSLVDTCVSLGFSGGPTTCSPLCSATTNECFRYGWSPLPSPTAADLHGVWATSDDAILAVGDGGSVVRFDGTAWLLESAGTSARLNGVWGAADDDVWAVGDAGTLAHYDGAGWTVSTVGGDDLLAIYGAAADDVFAVGAGGALLHYDGDSWSSMSSDTTATLRAVWVASPTSAFAAGDGGAIVEFDGVQWTAVASPWSEHLFGLTGTGPSDVWAVGTGIGAVHFDGADWTVHGTFAFELRAAIARLDDGVLAAGRFGDVSHYDGLRWDRPSKASSNDVNAMAATPSGRIYAAGRSGTLLAFNEIDRFPIAQPPHVDQPVGVFLRGIHVFDPYDIIAIDALGRVYQYNGSAWSSDASMQCCLSGYFYAMAGSANEVWIAGTDVLRYDGVSWESFGSGPPTERYGIWRAAANDVFVVGFSGRIERFDGDALTPMFSGTVEHLFSVHGTSGDDVYAGGENGTVVHWNGVGWAPMTFPSTHRVNALYAATPTDVFAATAGGELLFYDGVSWTVMRAPKLPILHRLAGTGPTDVFVAGEDGTLLHYDGIQWSPLAADTIATIQALAVDDHNIHYAGNGPAGGLDGVFRHLRRFHCAGSPSSVCKP